METRLRQSACSCSYSQFARAAKPDVQKTVSSALCTWRREAIGACCAPRSALSPSGTRRGSLRLRCKAGQKAGATGSGRENSKPRIDGYTPADYVAFSTEPQHRCHHMTAVEVNCPASVCFDIWNDWNRLVDFLDLVAQIGLDPEEPDMALFQCFYRWSQLPVLEIIMLATRTVVEENKCIQFRSSWGMPAEGSIEFIEEPSTKSPTGVKTTVIFKLEHAMPALLIDLSVGPSSVESHLRDIFTDNLTAFKQLAEAVASSPDTAPPRAPGQDRPSYGGPPGGVDGQMVMRSVKHPLEAMLPGDDIPEGSIIGGPVGEEELAAAAESQPAEGGGGSSRQTGVADGGDAGHGKKSSPSRPKNRSGGPKSKGKASTTSK